MLTYSTLKPGDVSSDLRKRLERAADRLKEVSKDLEPALKTTKDVDLCITSINPYTNIIPANNSSHLTIDQPSMLSIGGHSRNLVFGDKTDKLVRVESIEKLSLKTLWNLDVFYNNIPLLKLFTAINIVIVIVTIVLLKYI